TGLRVDDAPSELCATFFLRVPLCHHGKRYLLVEHRVAYRVEKRNGRRRVDPSVVDPDEYVVEIDVLAATFVHAQDVKPERRPKYLRDFADWTPRRHRSKLGYEIGEIRVFDAAPGRGRSGIIGKLACHFLEIRPSTHNGVSNGRDDVVGFLDGLFGEIRISDNVRDPHKLRYRGERVGGELGEPLPHLGGSDPDVADLRLLQLLGEKLITKLVVQICPDADETLPVEIFQTRLAAHLLDELIDALLENLIDLFLRDGDIGITLCDDRQHVLIDDLVERLHPDFVGVGRLGLLPHEVGQQRIYFRLKYDFVANDGHDLIEDPTVLRRGGNERSGQQNGRKKARNGRESRKWHVRRFVLTQKKGQAHAATPKDWCARPGKAFYAASAHRKSKEAVGRLPDF